MASESNVEPILRLALSQSGVPKPTLSNVVQILEVDPRYAGRLSYCRFRDVLLLDDERLEDAFAGELGYDLGRRYPLHAGQRLLEWAIDTVARRNEVDPLLDYLEGLSWDGVPRLDSWLERYLSVPPGDHGIVPVMGRKWVISALARALRPGCQVDTVLVLHGPQGNRKSSAVRVLAGDDWYLSSSIDVRSKDARVAIQGKWLVEWAELDALKRADANAAKAFITDREDDYRPPYGRSNVRRARRCVFVGTTNDPTFLADTTGDRRFWVVSCGVIDLEGLELVRDQLWAEARVALEAGETWWLDRDEEELRSKHVERYTMADPWEDAAAVWIAAKYPRGGFTGEELLTDQGDRARDGGWASVPGIGLETSRATAHALGRLAKVLTNLGMEQRRVKRKGRKVRLWFPAAPPPLELELQEEQGTKGPGEDQAPPVDDSTDAF